MIGQNGYFAGMRPLRDSGDQFAHRLLLYGSPSEVRWGNCNMDSVTT